MNAPFNYLNERNLQTADKFQHLDFEGTVWFSGEVDLSIQICLGLNLNNF